MYNLSTPADMYSMPTLDSAEILTDVQSQGRVKGVDWPWNGALLTSVSIHTTLGFSLQRMFLCKMGP